MSGLTWYEDGGLWECEFAVCVCGKVRYAAEGEAEGGLGALMRFQVGALHPSVEQPPLSPAGWYWTATRTRGVWETWRRAESLETAKAKVEETLRVRQEGTQALHQTGVL